MGLYTFPTEEDLAQRAAYTPQFMRPSVTPYAAAFEGFLNDAECDAILESLGQLEPYAVLGCGAITRECLADPTLNSIETAARAMNRLFWQYELDPGQHSWLQTYEAGGKYKLHADGSPGQTRKMTAVAMLSKPEDYRGGALRLHVNPKSHQVPRTRGTVVVFQPWIEHEVLPVFAGTRQTINMGFWGPPFV